MDPRRSAISEAGRNTRQKTLSNADLRALSQRRVSLPSIERMIRLRVEMPFRYEPDLWDLVERTNTIRDEVGDIVHDRRFDQQVPKAEEYRSEQCGKTTEATLASILVTTRALADYIDAVLEFYSSGREGNARSAVA
jgi:hypothetical protein